jgi:3alpha(or 20beta)-hydroxysteroid dehydrogenase
VTIRRRKWQCREGSVFDIAGKITLITGGNSGIGLATARRFAAAGATVVITNRSEAGALAASFGGEYLPADVSDEAQVEALIGAVVRRHGRVDVLVNSAGIIEDLNPITELSGAVMRRHFEVNTMGVWATMRHAAPHMEGGSIINVASGAGIIGLGGYAAYSASKAAVINLTQTAAVDLAHRRIRANCVCPGSIDTPMLRNQDNADDEIAVIETASTVGRIGTPEEIAALIHFLAADDCRYINGQAIVADGGVVRLYSNALFETLVAAKASR